MVIAIRYLFAVIGDMGLHPCDIADEEAHHIKYVGAEDNHILTATAMILLTAGIDGLDRADFSIFEHLPDRMGCGKIDGLMCHSNLFFVCLRSFNNYIAIGKRSRHRFSE